MDSSGDPHPTARQEPPWSNPARTWRSVRRTVPKQLSQPLVCLDTCVTFLSPPRGSPTFSVNTSINTHLALAMPRGLAGPLRRAIRPPTQREPPSAVL